MVPLHQPLNNGDHVEAVTARSARPLPAWLNYAVTSKARASIRHFLNQQKDKESVKLGRKMLKQALAKLGYRRLRIPSSHKVALLQHLQMDDWFRLLGDIGFGKRPPILVAKQMIVATHADAHADVAHSKANTNTKTKRKGGGRRRAKPTAITIEGTEQLLVTYANCCHPIPGDHIIGTVSGGRGVVVHRTACPNCKSVMRHPDNYFHLAWSNETKGKFKVMVKMETRNQPGALAAVTNIIAAHDSNINNLQLDPKHRNTSAMAFIIEVTDRKHLADIMRRLHGDKSVITLARA